MTRSPYQLIVPALLAVALAGPVSAHEREQGMLKDRSCLSACRQQARTCLDAPRTAARMCVQSTCSEKLSAVQTACASDYRSDACKAARQVAQDCLAPCRDALKTAVGTCWTDTDSCVTACPDREPAAAPTPKDPACVSGCRTAFGACVQPLQDTAKQCRDACSALTADARKTCTNALRSPACRDAQRAAYECLEPCASSLAKTTRACLSTAHDCAASCPDASQSGGQP